MTTTTEHAPPMADQATSLLSHAAGYSSSRTITIGLRSGLIETLAEHADGLTPEELAGHAGFDGFSVSVWCRAALGAGLCRRDGDRFRLAPHMSTLLLDQHSPAYVGGLFLVFEQPELFDRFEEVLPSGERTWWDR
ncbi:MAG: hypothetical protein WD080_12915, partial [Egibacteraceae bacterium]